MVKDDGIILDVFNDDHSGLHRILPHSSIFDGIRTTFAHISICTYIDLHIYQHRRIFTGYPGDAAKEPFRYVPEQDAAKEPGS